LESAIPAAFPQKQEIELQCEQLLAELGQDWFIVIAIEQKGRWGLAVSRRVPGRSPVLRNAHVHPADQNPNGIMRLLRPRVDEIRRATEARFGMMPVRPIAPDVADDLRAWARAHGGDVAEDGWVWLPDRASWEPFLERAAAVGAEYAAEVR
jgi:hypothetical protein